jgi:hypothetical protein
VTVPDSVPGAGGAHWLEELELLEEPTLVELPMLLELELELPMLLELELLLELLPPPLHDVTLFASRFARVCKPKPEASCGRTVTNRTTLAAAMTPKRVCRFQRFMFPQSAQGCVLESAEANVARLARKCLWTTAPPSGRRDGAPIKEQGRVSGPSWIVARLARVTGSDAGHGGERWGDP